jgi:lipoprotein-anchoring transpeptidase ErfK/SrfK
MRRLIAAAASLALAACGLNGTDRYQDGEADKSANATTENLADAMMSHDGADTGGDVPNIPDSEPRPIMQAQVVLDRQGFGPGVIDGKMGMSTKNALEGFQEANGLEVSGALDEPTKAKLAQWQTIPATRVVRIPADWGTLEYQRTPEKPEDQAKLERLGYQNLDEKLAERFHTTIDVLKMLNPGGKPAGMKEGADAGAGANPPGSVSPSPTGTASPKATSSPKPTPSPSGSEATADTGPLPTTFAAGQLIRVPNIGADRIAPGAVDDPDWQQTLQSLGVGTEQPKVERIVVSKSDSTLKGYDPAGKLVVLFTVSSGSAKFPLPLGNWKINGKAPNPPFNYDPELLGKEDTSSGKQKLPPGPNSPVGVVWIDLSKEHYGIHGTPDPETIGRAQSSGCVRLTNWDAARLAQMIKAGTKVEFIA